MVRTYCDVCGADVRGANLKHFFGGREYKIVERSTCDDDWEDSRTLTLCIDCNAVFWYAIQNHKALQKPVTQMRLSNRIRFLFKRPIKDEQRREEKWED